MSPCPGSFLMKYILKKIITLILALFLISVIIFLAFSVIPGDAAVAKLGTDATPERIAALKEQMGLNGSVFARYFTWLGNALRGDFGESLQYSGVSVSSFIGARIGTSAVLSVISFLMIIIVSIPVGVFAAKRRSGFGRASMTVITQITMGIPAFFLGILITYIFSIILKAFSIGTYGTESLRTDFWGAVRYLIFPAIAIALPKIAMTVKFLSTSIRTELHKEYVRTAYAKRLTRNGVFYKHVLKNAMIPVITFLGVIASEVVAGSIIVEQVFNVPGIGSALITAISSRDYNVVEAIVLLIAVFIIVINLLVDIIYQLIDPRVKL